MPELGTIIGLIGGKTKSLKSAIMTIGGVTPEQYGAKGDGTTDDSAAVQDACDAGYEVRFASNKTYYLASPVTIDHDCHLIGGENTVIKTKTPTGGTVDNGIVISGTLKKTTTLTSDYVSDSTSSENAGNRFKLTDMTGINAGDIMIITATDQHFSYNRPYYYMGGTLLIAEVVDGYLYTADTMPWDIENTANVSVRIYDAPVASVENLRFESDLDSSGSYKYPINLYQCKNSSVKNCTIKNMDNGLNIHECVNTLVDCVSLAYTPGMSGNTDHYGIAIYACNNTTISRVLGECANSCVDLSGNTPNMNTLITRSCLYGSNRVQGIGMHENAYNTVVTDSVIGGMIGYGTLIIERCRFVCRNRQSDSGVALTYRGDYDEKYSKLTIKDCTIEGEDLAVAIAKPSVSSPVQAYNHVVGEVYIENVTGGYLQYIPTSDSTILSNTIRKLIIKNWTNVKEIYHTSGSIIDYMLLENCQINHRFWINAHNYTFCFDGIGFLRLKNESPKQDRLYVDLKKNGGRYLLASGVPVSVSSSNSDAHYVICGNNIASNDATDYDAGSVSGSVGGALTRTHNSYRENDLSVNGNGQVVITNSSGSVCSFFLKCMVYVAEQSNAVISMKVKNTGSVSGVKCRPSIAVLDADTLLVTGISQATATEATSQGASVSHNRSVPANSFVQFYIYFNNPVNGAETTLEELSMTLTPEELPVPTYEEYQGDSITGNGTIYSVNGANNLMCSNNVFNANFKVDYVSNPV